MDPTVNGEDYLAGDITNTYLAGSQGLGPWYDDDDDDDDDGPGGTGSNPNCPPQNTSNC